MDTKKVSTLNNSYNININILKYNLTYMYYTNIISGFKKYRFFWKLIVSRTNDKPNTLYIKSYREESINTSSQRNMKRNIIPR